MFEHFSSFCVAAYSRCVVVGLIGNVTAAGVGWFVDCHVCPFGCRFSGVDYQNLDIIPLGMVWSQR